MKAIAMLVIGLVISLSASAHIAGVYITGTCVSCRTIEEDGGVMLEISCASGNGLCAVIYFNFETGAGYPQVILYCNTCSMANYMEVQGYDPAPFENVYFKSVFAKEILINQDGSWTTVPKAEPGQELKLSNVNKIRIWNFAIDKNSLFTK
ncbi:MAG: hypothetical protein GXO48_05675 [Chlorobi bacterium]|nr:hypothetical protein [Chlorobiota bacterium]